MWSCRSLLVSLLVAELPPYLLAAAGRATGACSCDCCEVEQQRGEGEGESRFECAMSDKGTQYSSPFRAQVSRCGNLCQQSAQDNVLTATEVQDIDTQRFCYFECEPRPVAKDRGPTKGDFCRPLSRGERKSVKDASGNAVPPNESPQLVTHFLASKSKAVVGNAGAVWAMRIKAARRALAAQRSSAAGSAGAQAAASELGGAPAGAPAAAGTAPMWASIDAEAQDQSAKVAEWAEATAKSAKNTEFDAISVEKIANKAEASVPAAIAKAELAKEASLKAYQDEEGVRKVRDTVLDLARDTAFEVIPEVLGEMKEQDRAEAKTEALSKAKILKGKMLDEAPKAAAAAAKPYEDAMKRAAATAAAWSTRGDGLSGQSSSMQMQSQLSLQQANSFASVGNQAEAQKMMQQAQLQMNMAMGLNAQATKFYATAKSIMDTLGGYMGEAAAAAYHAQVMLDPDAPPPSPPIV